MTIVDAADVSLIAKQNYLFDLKEPVRNVAYLARDRKIGLVLRVINVD